jgi:protein O-GlcNAc transferase
MTQAAAAKMNAALALHKSGQLDQADALYREVLQSQPRHFEALQLLGTSAAQQMNYATALSLFDQALQINPDHADLLNNRGYALRELARPQEALESYDRVLRMQPDFANAHNNRGLVLVDLKRTQEALESYDRALQILPHHAKALCNRGNALRELQRPDEALQSYDCALQINPDYAEALNNRGNLLLELGRLEAALQNYDRALQINPGYAEAINNRGLALRALHRTEESLKCFNQALNLQPDNAQVLNNRGIALYDLKRPEEAIASYDLALNLDPELAQAHLNRGNALCDLHRFEEAMVSYAQALRINPESADALNNCGTALKDLGRAAEALASFERALKINPELVEALINQANAYVDYKRPDLALACFNRALALRPDHDFLFGTCLHTRMKICDWQDYQHQCDLLANQLALGSRSSPPFPTLAITNSLALQLKAAQTWVQAKYPPFSTLPAISKRKRCSKVRIGYFSADLHNHATAHLMAELFERHDKSKFVITAFSFGPQTHDCMAQRLAHAFDSFLDVRTMSDQAVAVLARKLEIDIAIDLKGFTQDCRPGIFALRAAPIQVNYLGYPGTLGSHYIDYLIADSVLIPKTHQPYYAEKVVYLPDSYQVNDSTRPISDKQFSRLELGLPESGFVFCCFNSSYKITPDTFDGWMRILRQVQGSVLWLYEDNPGAADNLRKEARHRGVSDARLVFARRMDLPEHLARHRQADLFLDTLPYGAHTTASDALWAGLPVLSCLGDTFAGRVAASLLTAIDLPELVASTPQAYEALAIELATNCERLKQLKHRLIHNRLRTPLFDTGRFTRHLEAAYTAIHERYLADLAPAPIEI